MFRYLIRILESKEKRRLVKLSILMLISPIFDLFSFSVIIFILNIAIENNGASRQLVLFSAGMGAASLLKGIFELYKCYIQNYFVNHGSQKIASKIFELFQKEELMEHNKKTPIQALTIIRTDTTACMNAVAGFIFLWIQSITLIVFFCALIYVSHILGVIICLGMLGLMAVMYLRNRLRMMDLGKKCRQYAIRCNALVTTSFGMFKETKIGSRIQVLLDRYDMAGEKYADAQSRYMYKTRIISVLMQNVLMTALFFALAVVLEIGLHLSELLVPFLICMTFVLQLLPIAVRFVNELVNIEFGRESFAAVRDSMERYQAMKEREAADKKKRTKTITLQRGLFVNNLTFGYNDDKKIFDHASVEIPAGRTVAIIGASGSGKTTFLDLVLGLLHPESGEILYDDYDIVSESDSEGECTANVGDIVSYIPQTVYLNGENIKHNVAFYETEGQIQEERVKQCLQCAQIWEEVSKMPEGINTVIGENGLAISGGQRQRIALARALYKDFDLLIMDEATAALDMETEKAVLDSIRHVKGDKTLLMVTHHMSLADECELLYKIENQKILRIR